MHLLKPFLRVTVFPFSHYLLLSHLCKSFLIMVNRLDPTPSESEKEQSSSGMCLACTRISLPCNVLCNAEKFSILRMCVRYAVAMCTFVWHITATAVTYSFFHEKAQMITQFYLHSASSFLLKKDQSSVQNVKIHTCFLYIRCLEFVCVSMHFD